MFTRRIYASFGPSDSSKAAQWQIRIGARSGAQQTTQDGNQEEEKKDGIQDGTLEKEEGGDGIQDGAQEKDGARAIGAQDKLWRRIQKLEPGVVLPTRTRSGKTTPPGYTTSKGKWAHFKHTPGHHYYAAPEATPEAGRLPQGEQRGGGQGQGQEGREKCGGKHAEGDRDEEGTAPQEIPQQGDGAEEDTAPTQIPQQFDNEGTEPKEDGRSGEEHAQGDGAEEDTAHAIAEISQQVDIKGSKPGAQEADWEEPQGEGEGQEGGGGEQEDGDGGDCKYAMFNLGWSEGYIAGFQEGYLFGSLNR